MTVLSDNTYGRKHAKALSLWLGQTFDTSRVSVTEQRVQVLMLFTCKRDLKISWFAMLYSQID